MTTTKPKPQRPLSYYGTIRHKEGSYHSAAIIRHPQNREQTDAVFARLAPEARAWPLLAKQWKVWAVLAVEAWAFSQMKNNQPPANEILP